VKKIKPYLFLHLTIMVCSVGGIFSKTAASKDFLSFEFLLFYGLVFVVAGCYAIAWQQVIKSIPLNVAYANKAISLVWNTVWGVSLFNEVLTPQKVIGALIVGVGVVLTVTGGEKQNE